MENIIGRNVRVNVVVCRRGDRIGGTLGSTDGGERGGAAGACRTCPAGDRCAQSAVRLAARARTIPAVPPRRLPAPRQRVIEQRKP